MASMARVAIPTASHPIKPGSYGVGISNSRQAIHKPKPRTYGKGPLPTRPSEKAPHDAKITERYLDDRGVFYTLNIGEVEINDVRLEEILDYVSAQQLEEFETKQFEEEGELIRIAEEEDERVAAERALRRKMKAKAKAAARAALAAASDSDSDSGSESSSGSQDSDQMEVGEGKYGRARPTYAHLYNPNELKRKSTATSKQPKVRRRRKRDPRTGELLPLSPHTSVEEDDQPYNSVANTNEPEKRRRRKRDPRTGELLPLSPRGNDREDEESEQSEEETHEVRKRRRRKRDPVTGELLPLSPEKHQHTSRFSQAEKQEQKKRQRRRRHPITNELMPIGWKYDEQRERSSSTKRSAQNAALSPSMNRLSLSQEHTAKRMKLDVSSSTSSASSMSIVVALPDVIDLSSDESSEDVLQAPSSVNPPLGMLASRASLQMGHAQESSLERSPTRQPKLNTMTAVLPESESESDNELQSDLDEDLGDDEWFIEAILDHRMSDGTSHRPEYGRSPVMLYQVKWEGSNELTWEPIDSFPDREVIDDYEIRAGLKPAASSQGIKKHVVVKRNMSITNQEEEDDESEGQPFFEIEGVISHRMSDPKTHTSNKIRKPVMLYEVKWVGYDQTTWEEAKNFGDLRPVNQYRRKAGLLPIDAPQRK